MTGPRAAFVAIGIFLCLGTALRIRVFLAPHSLWADEANLGLNVIDRDVTQLFGPLDHDQYAPIGFLVITKLSGVIFGYNERALRLLPLLCGLIFPALMWRLARRCCSTPGTVAVVAVSALAPPLIQYSSQVKPYSVDSVASALVFLLYEPQLRDLRRDTSLQATSSVTREVGKGLAAAVLALFSFPAIFCLTGIVAVRVAASVGARRLESGLRIAAGAIPWMLTFALYFSLLLAASSRNDYLQEFWANFFLNVPLSLFLLRRDVELVLAAFGPTIGLDLHLGAVTATLGALEGWQDRHKGLLLAFLATVGLAAIASALHRWPFVTRTLLFTSTAALILVGWAVDLVCAGRHQAAATALIGSLLLGPAVAAKELVDSSKDPAGFRYLSEALRRDFRDGDIVYVYYLNSGEEAFYRRLRVFPDVPTIRSVDLIRQPWQECQRQIAGLKPEARVWFVVYNPRNFLFDERQAIRSALSTRRDELAHTADELYLFGPVVR